ncbi:S1 family peptidase [Nocardia sp. CA-135953]|uniref:S1 family peptidase n=1 Tax=Nocardia sp. CA-135953 TaxID=3239978 RepID=UPI003D980513
MQSQNTLESRGWLARVSGSPGGPICGAGVAVDSRHVLTAAHVVQDAGATGPGEHVFIDFPLLQSSRSSGRSSQAEVLPEGWALPDLGDHALLRLVDPPADITPAPLSTTISLDGHPFTAYGFPTGYDYSVPSSGTIGKASSLMWVALNVENDVMIDPGFSGGAVWSERENAVVALVVTKDVASRGKVGFAVPIIRIVPHSPVLSRAASAPFALSEFPEESAIGWFPTAAQDQNLEKIRAAFTIANNLNSAMLSTRDRLAIHTILSSLDDAAVDLLRGERRSSLALIESALATMREMQIRPDENKHHSQVMTTNTRGSGAIMVVKFMNLHAEQLVDLYHTPIAQALYAVHQLESTSKRNVTVDFSGSTMNVAMLDVEGDLRSSVQALFALAMSFHFAMLNNSSRIATVIAYADSLSFIQSPVLSGSSISCPAVSEAAAALATTFEPAFLVTEHAFLKMKRTGAISTGIDQNFDSLSAICGKFIPGADFTSIENISLKFSCELQPSRRLSFPVIEAYSVRIFTSDSGQPIIGTGSARIGNPKHDYLHVDESYPFERPYIDELAQFDNIEIVGVTNYRLADSIDRAWAIRMSRGLGPWHTLRIYYAASAILETLLPADSDVGQFRHRLNAGSRTMQMLLNSRGQAMAKNSRISEFSFIPPFIGTWFHSDRKSYFRVSPRFPDKPREQRIFFKVNAESELGQDLLDLHSRLKESSRDLFERTLWLRQLPGARHISVSGLHSSSPAVDNLRLATSLVILHAETAGARRLILQERTVFNSLDSAGTLSNLSARVFESDLSAFDPSATLTIAPREEDDEAVTTRAFRAVGIGPNSTPPRGLFTIASARECLGGLGLVIDPARFVWRTNTELTLGSKRLYFEIFTLALERSPVDEVSLISKTRPYANMRFIAKDEIVRLRRDTPARLNTLLRERLHDIFMPIFHELDVE